MTEKDYEEMDDDLEENQEDDELDESNDEDESTEDDELDESNDEVQDDEEQTEKEESSQKVQKQPKQSPQKNEYFKNLRLQEKEIDRIRQEERKKILLESVNYTNPYTQNPIKDEFDEEEYLTMREIEAEGKDPVSDYSSYVKEKKKEEKKSHSNNFDTKTDLIDFKRAYPNVDVNQLMQDQTFINDFGEDLGKVSLKTLYKLYERTNTKVKELEKKNLKEKRDSKNPGSAKGTNSRRKERDVADMDINSDEFEKMLQKAKRGELMSN